ncbi:MAG TPA: hypothetical protein VHQ47_08895 [Phycisphaerae bacterium]|jgi:hypothetical protein|nr:hypothetical protein [Phycisphaerae bacterium]
MNILAFQQAAREYVMALDARGGTARRCGRLETVEDAKAAFTSACDQEAAAFHALLAIVEAAVVDRIVTELVGKTMDGDKASPK